MFFPKIAYHLKRREEAFYGFGQAVESSHIAGRLLAESGAEISRVEESVYRLLQAYQGKDAQVFAIPSCLIVSLMAEDGRPVTRMRRISAHGTDLELLESCNALCRQLCRTVPPLDEARAMVDRLPGLLPPPPPRHGAAGLRYRPRFLLSPVRRRVLGQLERLLLRSVVGTCLLFGGRWLGSNSFLRTLVWQRHRLPAVSSAGAGGPGE